MTVGLDGGGDPDLMTQLFTGCSRAVPGLFPGYSRASMATWRVRSVNRSEARSGCGIWEATMA